MLTLLAAALLSVPPAAQDAALSFVKEARFTLLDASFPCQALTAEARPVRVMGQELPLAGVFGLRLWESSASANVRLAALAGPPGPYGLLTRAGDANRVDVTLARYSLTPAAFRVTHDGTAGCLLVYLPLKLLDGPLRLGPSTR